MASFEKLAADEGNLERHMVVFPTSLLSNGATKSLPAAQISTEMEVMLVRRPEEA